MGSILGVWALATNQIAASEFVRTPILMLQVALLQVVS